MCLSEGGGVKASGNGSNGGGGQGVDKVWLSILHLREGKTEELRGSAMRQLPLLGWGGVAMRGLSSPKGKENHKERTREARKYLIALYADSSREMQKKKGSLYQSERSLS